jgi:hypothetical protein
LADLHQQLCLANFWQSRRLFGKIVSNFNQPLFQEEQICQEPPQKAMWQ